MDKLILINTPSNPLSQPHLCSNQNTGRTLSWKGIPTRGLISNDGVTHIRLRLCSILIHICIMYDSEWCGCKTVIEESIIILSIDRLHYTIGQRRIKPEIETHEECLAMCFDSVLLLSLDCILRFRLFSKHVSNVRMNKNVIAFHSFDGHWIFMPCEWRQWPWTLCPTLN